MKAVELITSGPRGFLMSSRSACIAAVAVAVAADVDIGVAVVVAVDGSCCALY